MTLYVTFYESGPDALELIPAQYPAHRERVDAFHARGDLLMVGTFADPITEGAMAVFRTREAAARRMSATGIMQTVRESVPSPARGPNGLKWGP